MKRFSICQNNRQKYKTKELGVNRDVLEIIHELIFCHEFEMQNQ